MYKILVGLDPGAKGGISIYENGIVSAFDMPKTEADIVRFFQCINLGSSGSEMIVYIENVYSWMGSAIAAFNFGRNFGFLLGVLQTLGARICMVPPKNWQKELNLGGKKGMSDKDWKNKLMVEAQKLFPDIDVNLKTADSLLILKYALRREIK